ncbi:MAG: hypothetical protein WCV71_00770 [Patescibacteria group bacterium]
MFKMNLNKYLILSLVILTGFGSLVANAKEDLIISGDTIAEVLTDEPTLAICDHNGDGFRNLSDVSLFAEVKDSFSLSEIAEYAEHNQDNDWCEAHFWPSERVEETTATLAICDHNGDHVRNLSDVAMFAECAETFDVDGNGIHDLSDISLYTSNNQDDTWCASDFDCEAIPNAEPAYVTENLDVVSSTLAICDHNGDGLRNLSDVSEFASCVDTFDANGDNRHDLLDTSAYASNNQDNIWCRDSFVCDVATSTEALYSTEVVEEPVTPLAICDHNGDGLRNLSDVSEFASCVDTFDANGDGVHNLEDVSEYATNKFRTDTWCTTTFECVATPKSVLAGGSTFFNQPISEIEGEVLGEKIEAEEDVLETEVCTYNTPDADILGKTDWSDGSLIRGCGPEIYVIENQQKRHIRSLEELFNYIGQRINNVTNDILSLF